MKTTKDLRALALPELELKAGELKKELLKLNVQLATGGTVTKPSKIRTTKKMIARIYSIMTEKGGRV